MDHVKGLVYTDHGQEFDFVREPEILDRFDEKHTMDIEIREQEIDLLRLQENHSYEFSKITLETDFLNQKAHLAQSIDLQKNSYKFMSIIFIGITTLIGIALFLNKDSIVIEMFKAVVYLFAGGIGGYGFKNSNKMERSSKDMENKNQQTGR